MGFVVIHFSDIHIKNENDLILKRITEIKKACASVIGDKSTVVIVVSGDIAFSGKKEQYDIAEKIFNEISEYLLSEKNAKVEFVFVPGNHDCDFAQESSVRKALLANIKSQTLDMDIYNQINSIQTSYQDFSRNYITKSNEAISYKEILLPNGRILFVMINTAWMSELNEKPGSIFIPQFCLNDTVDEGYKIVFYTYHHPENWLDPDKRTAFINNVRKNADIVLVGHEHSKDLYSKSSSTFSQTYNHGKELQDNNSENSAFSVFVFDDSLQNYNLIDFVWESNMYIRSQTITKSFHKNLSYLNNVYTPNDAVIAEANDIGLIINHFAKDNVSLVDLFVEPDLQKIDYDDEKNLSSPVREDILNELEKNHINILVGSSSVGKSSLAKKIFMDYQYRKLCCIWINGNKFNTSNRTQIAELIEQKYVEQYSQDTLENFRQLPKNEKIIIIDDFDRIKMNNDRRSVVLDYVSENFGVINVFVSSNVELTSVLSSNTIKSLPKLVYYDILPLGNRKRKQLIRKWYELDKDNFSDDEIESRIDKSIALVDNLLGNGGSYVPAIPLVIITALQNTDAKQTTFNGSKYGFLYETLILGNLAKSGFDVTSANYNIEKSAISLLAFYMLFNQKTNFTFEEFSNITETLRTDLLIPIEPTPILNKFIGAELICKNDSEGDVYRFKYPYIYYYYAGNYIANNSNKSEVKAIIEYMSARLYNEIYGNILIFVCHFSNNQDVLDEILLNAYTTLENYATFDFTKENPIFDQIQDSVNSLVSKNVVSNDEVEINKDKKLKAMDDIGINDGSINHFEDNFNDEISEQEQTIASISSALKILDVLGQILQNYPANISGQDKVEMINTLHKLGMRAVQAMIDTLKFIENDLVNYIVEKTNEQNKNYRREDIENATRLFISKLMTSMVRGMVKQVAVSLNSEYLLPAANITFCEDESISSKLILAELKMNFLNKFNYNDIKDLRNAFSKNDELFALKILDAIINHYLNYNKCDQRLRAKLCNLCGFSENKLLIENKKKEYN